MRDDFLGGFVSFYEHNMVIGASVIVIGIPEFFSCKEHDYEMTFI